MTSPSFAALAWLFVGALLGMEGASPRHPQEDGASFRLGTSSYRHSSGIQALGVSPDGKILASGGQDGWVRIWESSSGRELGSHRLDAGVSGLAFSSDGTSLLCADSQSDLRRLSLPTGREVERLPTPLKKIRCLASSPREDVVAVGGEATLFIWDAGKKLAPVVGAAHQGPIDSVAFSPDGRLLASASSDDEAIQVWKIPDFNEPIRLVGSKFAKPRTLAFLPDGRSLAAGCLDSSIRVWDLEKKEVTTTLTTSGPVTSFDSSRDGTLFAAACGRPIVHVWDSGTGKELHRIDTHCWQTSLVRFHRDGKTLLTAGNQGGIRFWDAAGGQNLPRPGESHQGRVTSIAVSPSGETLASGAEDGTVCFWDLPKKRLNSRAEAHENPVLSLSFSPDGRTLASGSGDAVCLWEVQTGVRRLKIKDSGGGLVVKVAFLGDGKTLAVATSDSRIDLWDARTGDRLRIVAEREGPVTSLLSIEGRKALAWSDHLGAVSTLTLDDGHDPVKLIAQPPGSLFSLSLSPDQRTLAAGGDHGEIRIWNLDRKKTCLELTGGSRAIESLAHSPDGRLLASVGSDSSLRLWDLASGHEILALRHEDGPPLSVAFTPDGKELAVGMARSTIVVWNLARVLLAERPPEAPGSTLLERLENEKPLAAHQAIQALVQEPEKSLDALRQSLRPDSKDPGRMTRLLAQLEDDNAEVRRTAQAELEWCGDLDILRKTAAGQASPELRERVEEIVASQDEPRIRWPRGLAIFRAIQGLEQLALPSSDELLEFLAQGPDCRQRREAQHALERRTKKPGK
jgi:WD40 repeat protein